MTVGAENYWQEHEWPQSRLIRVSTLSMDERFPLLNRWSSSLSLLACVLHPLGETLRPHENRAELHMKHWWYSVTVVRIKENTFGKLKRWQLGDRWGFEYTQWWGRWWSRRRERGRRGSGDQWMPLVWPERRNIKRQAQVGREESIMCGAGWPSFPLQLKQQGFPCWRGRLERVLGTLWEKMSCNKGGLAP